MTAAALEVRQLRKQYRKVEALRGVDFVVEQGSVCGFLGPNGAGKTTTMKILMGLIRPSSGWAAVLGEDVRTRGLVARTRVGYLPQDPTFPQHASVRSVVASVARLYPNHARGRALRTQVDSLIDRVGMSDKAGRKVRGLSGGERQRLGIAQALVGDPDLVILDEPSSGLDPIGRKDMLELIEAISSEAAVFYSTHILDDVERISDSVVMLSKGVVVAQGTIEDILTASVLDYSARLKGDTTDLRSRMSLQPWIDSVDIDARDDREVWSIHLRDEAAGHKLVPLLVSDESSTVVEFHASDRRLEDSYLELVGVHDSD